MQRQRVDVLLPLIGATDIDDWCDALAKRALGTRVKLGLRRAQSPEALADCLETFTVCTYVGIWFYIQMPCWR
jgi:hypothetical protein